MISARSSRRAGPCRSSWHAITRSRQPPAFSTPTSGDSSTAISSRANLILDKSGVVKILDFGLAKAIREHESATDLTLPEQTLGTPDFLAPEQSRDARKADIRADVYSLGCTLYYLLSGAPPFRAPTVSELLEAHRSVEAQPLDQVRADVPLNWRVSWRR